MSRIDLSGARISRRRVLPSGLDESEDGDLVRDLVRAVRGARAMSRTATTANRLNNLLGCTTLDTVIGPKYTGARLRQRGYAARRQCSYSAPAGRGEPRWSA